MIDEIMNAIARKLYSLFGDGYEIYKNSIEQDLQEPCFLISLVSADKNAGALFFNFSCFCRQEADDGNRFVQDSAFRYIIFSKQRRNAMPRSNGNLNG